MWGKNGLAADGKSSWKSCHQKTHHEIEMKGFFRGDHWNLWRKDCVKRMKKCDRWKVVNDGEKEYNDVVLVSHKTLGQSFIEYHIERVAFCHL